MSPVGCSPGGHRAEASNAACVVNCRSTESVCCCGRVRTEQWQPARSFRDGERIGVVRTNHGERKNLALLTGVHLSPVDTNLKIATRDSIAIHSSVDRIRTGALEAGVDLVHHQVVLAVVCIHGLDADEVDILLRDEIEVAGSDPSDSGAATADRQDGITKRDIHQVQIQRVARRHISITKHWRIAINPEVSRRLRLEAERVVLVPAGDDRSSRRVRQRIRRDDAGGRVDVQRRPIICNRCGVRIADRRIDVNVDRRGSPERRQVTIDVSVIADIQRDVAIGC